MQAPHRAPGRVSSALLASALLLPPTAAGEAGPGYQVSSSSHPAPGATTVTTVAGGDLVTWDGTSVRRHAPDGTLIATLATFNPAVFPSFALPAPDGVHVTIGNSSNGRIHLVDLGGSGRSLLARIPLNFDACYDGQGDLLVVGGVCSFGCGSRILRVEGSPGAVTRIARVDGPSGPLALDAAGNLVYAAVDPTTFRTSAVLRWSAAQLQQPGGGLTELDATVVATDFDTPSSLLVDPVRGGLFLATNDFGAFTHRIVRVHRDGASSPVVASGPFAVGSAHFLSGGGAASFDAYQPADGVNLRARVTDFGALDELRVVRPLRPVLTVSGPGTTGPGPFTFALTGAEPNAGATLLYAPQATFDPVERSYDLPTLLLHTGLDLTEIERTPFPLATDGTGAASVTFSNPGGLEGLFAFQFLVRDAAGVAIGSSNSVLF